MRELAMLRVMLGLKQYEVAKELNVTQGTVSAWETGTSMPTVDKIPMLATLYGVESQVILNAILNASHNISISETEDKCHDE